MLDLFGEEIIEDVLLRDVFIEPPFSVLDTKTGSWAKRKRKWKEIGLSSEVGRDATTFSTSKTAKKDSYMPDLGSDSSIFDPALTELMYRWFCPDGGKILDPFAGGSVRGIVAHYLGYDYTGIELREEQVYANYQQANDILPLNLPYWITGDSNKELDKLNNKYDLVFTCPPYFNLEVYSKLADDISNMDLKQFTNVYTSIIQKTYRLLKNSGYAVIVVGDVRDKKGFYIDLLTITKTAFYGCGYKLYNEAILLDPIGTAMLRARGNMKNKKLVKVHQNILIFKKDLR